MNNLNILLLAIFLLLLLLIAIVLIAQYQYMRQQATVIQPAGCLGTRWGCCQDGITAKEDSDGTNCADYEMHLRPPVVPTIAMDVQPPQVQVLPTELQRPMLPVKPPQVQVLPTELQKPMTPLKPAKEVEKPMTSLKPAMQNFAPPKGNEKFTNNMDVKLPHDVQMKRNQAFQCWLNCEPRQDLPMYYPLDLQKPMTPLKPAMQNLAPPKGNEKFTNYAFI